MSLARWMGPEQPDMEPPFYDFRNLWCPHPNDRFLFWYEGVLSLQPGMYRSITRYPTHTDTDEFFAYIEEDMYPTDTNADDEAEDSDWFGVLDTINAVRFWEAPVATDDGNTMNWDEESSENEEGDEHWSRQPPINTGGSEWFYD